MLAKTSRKIQKVAIFGDAEATEKDVHYYLAKETAKLLAKDSYEIVNGGGPGVMLAATLGAQEVGGKARVVVIAKGVDMGPNYEGQFMPNVGIANTVIEEQNYPDRLRRLMTESDAYVIFRGGTGTVSELGMVWADSKFNFGNHKPIIFVGDFWRRIMDDMSYALAIDEQERSLYAVVRDPAEVVEIFRGFRSS